MDDFGKWLISPVGNAFAGWGGILLSIAGFIITGLLARRAKTAAEHAATAANRALQGVSNIDVLQKLTESTSIINEIQRLQQSGAHPSVISDRYSFLIKLVVQIAASKNLLDEDTKGNLSKIVHRASLVQRDWHKMAVDPEQSVNQIKTTKWLVDDGNKLNSIHAVLSEKVRGDYGR